MELMEAKPRAGLLFFGDREARDNLRLDEHRLGPTAEAFRAEGIEVEACVYNDDFADEVREQLLTLDGVQVWVNPITEDGRTRSKLDALLAEVSAQGVLVSSHPSVIQKIGTKSVLFDTGEMGWAGDVHLYEALEEMRSKLAGLLRLGPRVIKQQRGHSGQGIWKVSMAGSDKVRVKPATRGSTEEEMTLEAWIDSCRPYFTAGPMLDQEFNSEIDRGMIRCYLVRDRVEGFGHQEVNALVPESEPGPRFYFQPDHPAFQDLKRKVEHEWLPQLMRIVNLAEDELPHLWDMDFMLKGEGYMLCEINVSSVFPYPESAIAPLAKSFKSRLGLAAPFRNRS